MEKRRTKVIVFGSILVVGIIILMNCVNLGKDEAYNLLMMNGGSMDTSTYSIYIEQYIINYRVIGSILMILGGVGLLINTSVKAETSKETLETQETEKEEDI